MDNRDHHSTLEELLAAVEQDVTLRGEASKEVGGAEGQPQGEAAFISADGGAGGLGALLSHPELLSKLPALIKVVQTLTEPTPKGELQRPATPVALLCALRPYLNDHRRQALDTMIRVSRLSESLRSLQ